MAGKIVQTYSEKTGEAVAPRATSDGTEWSPNQSFNITQIILDLQSTTTNQGTRITASEEVTRENAANIAVNAANIVILANELSEKANTADVIKNASALTSSASQKVGTPLLWTGDTFWLMDKSGAAFVGIAPTTTQFGRKGGIPTAILSNESDIIHYTYTKESGEGPTGIYKMWDSRNLPTPATMFDIKKATSGYLSSVNDGFLVKTKITPASLAMCTLTVTGNSYTPSSRNYLSVIQFYSYTADQIPYAAVTHVGTPFDVQIFYYEGFVHLYISKLAASHSTLSVTGTVTGGGPQHSTLRGHEIVRDISPASAVPDGATVITTPKAYLMASQDDLNNAFKVVSALPATGDPKYIYLLPKSESESNDSYYEYIWLKDYSRWERIGSTQIDLSDYYTTTQADARYVRLDPTAQTITGIKTFASLPIVPTVDPSADGQVVSRAWLNKKVQPIQTAVTSLQGDVGDMKPTVTKHSADISSLNASVSQLETEVAGKENKLRSGENIRTINGQSILGAGNIEIAGGGSSWNVVEIEVETGQPVPAVNVTGSTIFRAIGSAVNNSLAFNIENPSDTGTSLLKAGESFKVVCYAVIDVTFNAENIGSKMFDLDWESQSGTGTGSESYMEYEVTYTGQELLFKRRRFTYANE